PQSQIFTEDQRMHHVGAAREQSVDVRRLEAGVGERERGALLMKLQGGRVGNLTEARLGDAGDRNLPAWHRGQASGKCSTPNTFRYVARDAVLADSRTRGLPRDGPALPVRSRPRSRRDRAARGSRSGALEIDRGDGMARG